MISFLKHSGVGGGGWDVWVGLGMRIPHYTESHSSGIILPSNERDVKRP